MTSPGPIAFTLFGVDIRWYGILIALGALLAIAISCYRAPKHGLTQDNVLDIAIFSLPIGIIGARVYYVIFEWDMYRGNFAEMINIRNGGLAIHGGLIFGITTAYIVCKCKKLSFFEATDLIIPTVALAQAIGRWGNFFNSEAHGGETTVPWAILVDGKYVHPTFLYESIWCVIIFITLILIDRNRKFAGQLVFLYGMMYSVERFFVEALRTDSLMIGPFKQAQLISLCIFGACAILYITFARRNKISNNNK